MIISDLLPLVVTFRVFVIASVFLMPVEQHVFIILIFFVALGLLSIVTILMFPQVHCFCWISIEVF